MVAADFVRNLENPKSMSLMRVGLSTTMLSRLRSRWAIPRVHRPYIAAEIVSNSVDVNLWVRSHIFSVTPGATAMTVMDAPVVWSYAQATNAGTKSITLSTPRSDRMGRGVAPRLWRYECTNAS